MVSMAIASMWASIASWFTPTVLFCATNLIIATIFIASNNTNSNSHHDNVHGDPNTKISRVSSFLERARSMKLSSYSTTTTTTTTGESESQFQYPSEPTTATFSSSSLLAQSIHEPLSQPAHSPSLFQRVTSFKLSDSNSVDPPGQLVRSPSIIERVKSFKLFGATSSSTEPESDPGHNSEHHVNRSKSEKTPAKKSMSEMKKSRSEMRIAQSDSDDEDVDLRRPATARERPSHYDVDAKADDFITRFKQNLKLQRLESLVRYNQMLHRSG